MSDKTQNDKIEEMIGELLGGDEEMCIRDSCRLCYLHSFFQ